MATHMRVLTSFSRLLLLLIALGPATAAAQIPTGTISGRVTDSQGRSIGAVTVTVQSPALQGVQTTTTTINGDYVFRLLPPGVYTVTFEGPGFAALKQTRNVAATEAVSLSVTLQPAVVAEEVTVVADATAFTNTVESASNFDQQLMNLLPTARTLDSAVLLAPAVHATGPGGAISIGGAMSFESLFLVNGVQIQDNIRGEPLPLYIEDAIQETTVTTSGISAEYGRFSGGVVNVLTKSGGNLFSGSFRNSFRNDNWRSVSPFDESKIDKLVPTYEYTFGGPILQDRTWFFLAGRLEDASTSRETGYTNLPFVQTQDEKRFEFKVTQSLAAGHRLEGAYTAIQRKQTNAAQPSATEIMDLASLTNPELPESLLALHYTGTWRNNLFFEAQYSARTFTFRNAGGTNRDRIFGTTLMDQTTGAHFWAPLYCAVCGDEERNNDGLLLKGSYFLSTANGGSHNVVFGYDGFNDKMKVDNHQSASDWHVWTTGSVIDNGVVYPVIEPGFSTYIISWPIRESSQGTNFRTHGLFVNDTWDVNRHVTVNLGLRYDKNAGRDASNNLVANDSIFAPRLGVVWDPNGDGRTAVNASFSRYAAAIANTIGGSGSPAGNPAILGYFYFGDPINTGAAPYVSSDAALRQVFDWFDASGGESLFFADIPGLATRIDGSLRSPRADEFVVGLSQQVGTRGAVRFDVVNRTFGDFYVTRRDLTTGQAEDEFGQLYDVGLIENTNDLKRTYRALNAQASYRVGTGINTGMSYTLSRLQGNFNGETVFSGPVTSSAFSYPEFSDPAWSRPEGDLASDQRHRARIWGTWSLPWGRGIADMVLGATQTLESGTPYGALGAVDVSSVAVNGYAVPPSTSSYYFTSRDAFRTEGQVRTDLSFNVSRRLGSTRAPVVFAHFQLLNAFNQFQLYNITGAAINTTVLTAVDDPSLEFFDPFTETPVEGVHWMKGEQFGQAVGRTAYTTGRTFRFSVGVRF
jgi:outer membrane receptor protein involved in Fe transport